MTAIRASAGERASRRASSEPKPALIWAVGPSRPPEPPEPIVIAEETILTSATRARIPSGRWWTASIAASVPCPSASGASRKTITPAASPPSATTSGSRQLRVVPDSTACPSPIGEGGW